MNRLAGVFGKLALIIVSFIVCCAGLVWHTVHLHLLHRPAALIFIYMSAWGTVWICVLTYALFQNQLAKRIATGLLTVVGLWLAWQTATYRAPGPTGALTTLVDYSGKKIVETAEWVVQEAPTEILCNKTTYRRITFFAQDTTTGKRIPKVWYSERGGLITCFNRDGYDPLYGTGLKPVTETVVLQIAEQSPPQPQTPPQIVSAPVPVPSPAPSQAPSEAPSVWGPERRVVIMSGDPDQ